MFAVIRTGGKQYRVAAEDQITIMRLPGEAGEKVTFGDVLMLADGDNCEFGIKASVTGEIVSQSRSPKIIAFKKRRRKHSERKRGHKQDLTIVKITGIERA